MVFLLLSMIFFWVVAATVIGYWVGVGKGRPTEGALLGLFLGWIGVVIEAVRPVTEEKQRTNALKQADILRSALGGSDATGSEFPRKSISREQVLSEVLKRNPELQGKSDPESLAQISTLSKQITKELELKAELESLEASKENARRAEALEQEKREQALQEQERWKEKETQKRALAESRRQQRQLHIASLPPLRRYVAQNPLKVVSAVVLLALIAGIIVTKVISINNSNAELAANAAIERALSPQLSASEISGLVSGLELAEERQQGPGFIGNKPSFERRSAALLQNSADMDSLNPKLEAIEPTLEVITKPTGCEETVLGTKTAPSGPITMTTVRRWKSGYAQIAVYVYDFENSDSAQNAMNIWRGIPKKCTTYHTYEVPNKNSSEFEKRSVIDWKTKLRMSYPSDEQIRKFQEKTFVDKAGFELGTNTDMESVDLAGNRVARVVIHWFGPEDRLKQYNNFAAAAVNKALADKGAKPITGPIWNLG